MSETFFNKMKKLIKTIIQKNNMNHFTLYPTKAEAIATSSLYPPFGWIPKNLSDEEIDLIKKYESKSLDDPNYWEREERSLEEDLSLDDLSLEEDLYLDDLSLEEDLSLDDLSLEEEPLEEC